MAKLILESKIVNLGKSLTHPASTAELTWLTLLRLKPRSTRWLVMKNIK
jgi:hypothetical protein